MPVLILSAGAALLTGAAARSAAPRAAELHFTVRDLGVPANASGSFSTAVNNSGRVAGYWNDQNAGYPHAFVWDAVNGMRNLPELSGDIASVAFDINDAGQVVGTSISPDGGSHAVRWDADRSVHDLGNLSPNQSGNRHWAAGINNATAAHGVQITGVSYSTTYNTYRPFIWDAQHGMQDIGPKDPAVSGKPGQAWSINDAGQVSGALPTGGVDHAFRWDSQTGLIDIDPTGTTPSVGYSINAAGHAAGLSYSENFSFAGVTLWGDAGKVMFGNVPFFFQDDLPGVIRPLGINTAGEIACTSSNGISSTHAYFFDGTTPTDLNTVTPLADGNILKSALDINDQRQIVGDLYVAEDGHRHAYLLTFGTAPAASADLQVLQTSSASAAQTGQNITYTLTVKNLGTDTAHGVTVTDPLPAGSVFVSSNPAVTPVNGQLTFSLGTLAANSTQTLTVTVKAQSAGTLTNQPTVSGSEPDPNPANNTVSTSVTITQEPPAAQADLGVTLTASPTVVQVGKTVTLTAVVTNHGPSAASGVTLTPNAGGVALAPISIGALGVNKSATRTFTVAPQAAGSLSVTVTAAGNEADASGSDNTAPSTITVQSAPPTPKPDLSGQWSGVGIVRSGSAKKPVYTLTGTLTVRNGGTATAAATTATFAASTDGVLDASDLILMTSPKKAATLKIPALKAGAGKAFKFSFKLPAGMSPSVLTGLNVIGTIDAGNKVAEFDETNNLAVSGPIQ